MEITKFVQYHGYLSSVSLRLQMDYRNTWISCFTRQLDLELMFTSIISLCMANWNKWTKLITDLLALSIGSTYSYSLALFIRFSGFTHWIYLLALFIRFGGFIYLPYLWALVSAYTVFILIANSVFLTSQKGTPLHFSQYTYPTFSWKKSSAFHYVITRA